MMGEEGWQKIETAPQRNEWLVLSRWLAGVCLYVTQGIWTDTGDPLGGWIDAEGAAIEHPTHWMKLEPPTP